MLRRPFCFDRCHAPAWERSPGRSSVPLCQAQEAMRIFPLYPKPFRLIMRRLDQAVDLSSFFPALLDIFQFCERYSSLGFVTLERHGTVPTLEHGNHHKPEASPCCADLPGDLALYAISVRRLIASESRCTRLPALRLPPGDPSRFRPCLRLVFMVLSLTIVLGFTFRGRHHIRSHLCRAYLRKR